MPPSQALRRPDQLQREPELLRVLEVVRGDLLDALVAHLVEVHGGVEGEPREDRHLRGRVLAGHVLGRVGLRVSERLGLRERVRVGGTRARHLGEDEVGGAVHDPVDALDVGRGERLRHHPDRRHHAGHGALEAELDPVLARGVEDLLAELREQLLVGRDHVAPGAERAQDVLARGLRAAHQLDHEVAALEQVGEVALAASEHAGHLRPAAGLGLDGVGPRLQQLVERGAHGAVSQQRDPERALRRHEASDRRRSRGAPRAGRGRRGRTRPGGGAARCSCSPSSARTRRLRG